MSRGLSGESISAEKKAEAFDELGGFSLTKHTPDHPAPSPIATPASGQAGPSTILKGTMFAGGDTSSLSISHRLPPSGASRPRAEAQKPNFRADNPSGTLHNVPSGFATPLSRRTPALQGGESMEFGSGLPSQAALKHLFDRGQSPKPKSKLPKEVSSDPKIYRSYEHLPVTLSGHVVVCISGSPPLAIIQGFLARIWRKHHGILKKIPVVIIHPSFPEVLARDITGADASALYLIEGNSLSKEVLSLAQYDTAKSVVIITRESRGDSERTGDSRAIFTLMTLDHLLKENSDTFVCCVLDSEESVELLRGAVRPRRKKRHLGEAHEPTATTYLPLDAEMKGGITHSISAVGRRKSLQFDDALRHMDNDNIARRMTILNMARLTNTSFHSARMLYDEDFERESTSTESVASSELSVEKTREEILEQQRYASGELMLTSPLSSILVKEYNQPGYLNVISKLSGARRQKRPWIRLIDVPADWIDMSFEGRTFRDVFIRMLQFGCFAIGLYRSGDAPVAVEVESTLWKRNPGGDYKRPMNRSQPSTWNLMDEIRRLGDSDFDEAELCQYFCPSSGRVVTFSSFPDVGNILPYVMTFPEPYTPIAETDAVYILCRDDKSIPSEW